MTWNVVISQRLNDMEPNEPTNKAIHSSHGRTTKTMCDVLFDHYCIKN